LSFLSLWLEYPDVWSPPWTSPPIKWALRSESLWQFQWKLQWWLFWPPITLGNWCRSLFFHFAREEEVTWSLVGTISWIQRVLDRRG
jgi:hypothetical protein